MNKKIKIIKTETPLNHLNDLAPLKGFNPNHKILIFSNRKTKDLFLSVFKRKQNLQNKNFFLKKVYSLEEFWHESLKKIGLFYQTLPISSMQTKFMHAFNISSNDYYKQKRKIQKTLQLVYELMPIFSHPNGFELLQEYTFSNKHKRNQENWLRLSEKAYVFFKKCIKEKIILKPWIEGIISHINAFDQFKWDEELIFDLGINIDSFRAELIFQLSRMNSISILIPDPQWKSLFEEDLKPYLVFQENDLPFQQRLSPQKKTESHLKNQKESFSFHQTETNSFNPIRTEASHLKNQKGSFSLHQTETNSSNPIRTEASHLKNQKESFSFHQTETNSFNPIRTEEKEASFLENTNKNTKTLFSKPNIQIKRHTGFLSEIKEAIFFIKKWMNESITPSEILLLAPDRSLYKDMLSFYLKKEDIFLSETSNETSFHSFKVIENWISKLKIESGDFNFYDLESDFVLEKNSPLERAPHSYSLKKYETFKNFFHPLLTEPQKSNYLKFFKKEFQKSKKEIPNLENSKTEKKRKEKKKAKENEINQDKLFSKDEFISWAFDEQKIKSKSLSKEEQNLIYEFLNFFSKNTPFSFLLSLTDWIFLLENLSFEKLKNKVQKLKNKNEPLIEQKDEKNLNKKTIPFENLVHGFEINAKCVFILGLNDFSLQSKKLNSFIPSQDLLKISKDLGFLVPLKNSIPFDFSLYWLMEKKFNEIVLSYPMTDYSGESQAPSKIWMEAAKALNYNWESTPSSSKEVKTEIKPIPAKPNQNTHLKPNQNTPLNKDTLLQWKFLRDTLSLKDIEAFEICPFIFASRKVFSLSPPFNFKKEIDPLFKSQLASYLFKDLEKQDQKQFVEDTFLTSFESSLKSISEKGNRSMDQRLKPFLKEEYKKFSIQLLNKKEKWNQISNQPSFTQNHLTWNLIWDFKTKDFKSKEISQKDLKKDSSFHRVSKANGNSSVKKKISQKISSLETSLEKRNQEKKSIFPSNLFLQGKVNHIKGFWDKEKKFYKYILFQYIHSSHSKKQVHYKSWMKNNLYNLPISAYVIDQSLTELPKGRVVGAFYLNPIKEALQEKGFFIQEFYEDSFSPFIKHFSLVKEKDLFLFYENYKKNLNETLLKISKGMLYPKPKNQSICLTCQWKKICRAPHLI